MDARIWFTDDRDDGTAEAMLMDDLDVTIDRSGLTTIDGPSGGSTTIDFDDAVILVAVLAEAIKILRGHGHRERDEVLGWLAEHQGRTSPRATAT